MRDVGGPCFNHLWKSADVIIVSCGVLVLALLASYLESGNDTNIKLS